MINFLLYTNKYKVDSKESYLNNYDKIIAFGGEFSTGGYAPSFIEDWINDRIEHNYIEDRNGILEFTDKYKNELVTRINQY